MDVLGIAEAGRGSVLGPLVIAGVSIPENKCSILERMGVKDSKRLTRSRRHVLARKLEKMFDFKTVIISAKEIDDLRAEGVNLNEIERLGMEKIISEMNPEKVIVDAVDIKADRFQEVISNSTGANVIAEHKADDNYIEVSAASIIAKQTRDELIAQINKDYRKMGGIGSGYPSDPTTKKFLTNFTYDEMPDFVRKSWATVKNMK